jgi:pyruvate kinase
MLDTKGPEIRTHNFESGSARIERNRIFRICASEILGTADAFSVNYANLCKVARPGKLIKIDDGKFVAKIMQAVPEENHIVCKSLTAHTLKNHKGVNIVGVRLDMDFLSEKDRQDIAFGVSNDIDFVAASFVRRKDDCLQLRNYLDSLGAKNVKIISKIESKESISRLPAIVRHSDAIMVARGDLGVELLPEEVPIIQIKLIDECALQQKPIIIATQMLESMQHSLLPTRAEVNDVALAIFQGTDCVMLSGESASGEFPVQSTLMQKNISLTSEPHLDYSRIFERKIVSDKKHQELIMGACITAINSKAKLIVAYDEEGNICTELSAIRPYCPVICLTTSVAVARSLSLYWGVYAFLIDKDEKNNSEMKFVTLMNLVKNYRLRKNDKLIMIRTKTKSEYGLSEESLRLITLDKGAANGN